MSYHPAVVQLLPTGLALLAVLLIGIGILSMSAGDFAVAGASFLCASLVIYLRETTATGD